MAAGQADAVNGETAPNHGFGPPSRVSRGYEHTIGASSGEAGSDEPEGSELHHTGQPSGSALRRGMACEFCRRRKLRCTGDHPTCTHCIKYRKHCEYGPPNKVAKVKALESRIAQLSDYIQQSGIPQPSHLHTAFSVQPLSQVAATAAKPHDSSSVNWRWSNGFSADLERAPREENAEYLNFIGQDYFANHEQAGLPTFTNHTHDIHGAMHRASVGPSENAAVGQVYLAPSNSSIDRSTFEPNFGTFPPLLSADSCHMGTFTSSINPLSFAAQNGSSPATEHFSPDHATGSQYAFVYDRGVLQAAASRAPGFTSLSTSGAGGTAADHASAHLSTAPLAGQSQSPTDMPIGEIRPWGATQNISFTTPDSAVDGLTESLGEFLLSPKEESAKATPTSWTSRKVTQATVNGSFSTPPDIDSALIWQVEESDGLSESTRNILVDRFLVHSRLFFQMSVARFRYRMTFRDQWRPHPALLNAMCLFATRMSNSLNKSAMEQYFFAQACRQLNASSSSSDRLIDGMRAAMLLCTYSYTSGRFHDGWCLGGTAVRLAQSTGIHQIASLTLKPQPLKDPFLRHKTYLLPPPEDAVELAERVHTFWSIFAIDRCGAMATGFPLGFRDEDIRTPLPVPLADICSGNVTHQDDTTINDSYRLPGTLARNSTHIRWLKSVALLERASKLAFLEPDEFSELTIAWNAYALDPTSTPPPVWLDQPQYRCPKDYHETKFALDQLLSNIGEDGVFPVDRKRNAEILGLAEPAVPARTIVLHHMLCAVYMLLHDINSLEVENTEALVGARKSVALFQWMPPVPDHQIDSFCILVWSMICKILLKEMHRLRLANDGAAQQAEEEASIIIENMSRIGVSMHIARTQAAALEELKRKSIGIDSTDWRNLWTTEPLPF